VSRVFDAPPELVYRAFADPDQLCEWFGPQGFSVPCETVQIDARAGGFQRFTIISDDDPGQRGTVAVELTEVIENELLAGHQDVTGVPYAGATGHARLHLRLEFHDEPHGKTRLDLHQGPFTGEAAEAAADGWDSSFSKLDALLRASR
jgi:uncharacterized protein YndB with AHSA1/START domain